MSRTGSAWRRGLGDRLGRLEDANGRGGAQAGAPARWTGGGWAARSLLPPRRGSFPEDAAACRRYATAAVRWCHGRAARAVPPRPRRGVAAATPAMAAPPSARRRSGRKPGDRGTGTRSAAGGACRPRRALVRRSPSRRRRFRGSPRPRHRARTCAARRRRRCSTWWCASTSRRSWRPSGPSTARACPATWSRSCAGTFGVACSRMDF
jgi:hypothetical protein